MFDIDPSEQYDVVCFFLCLHDMTWPSKALKSAAQMLRPNGLILVAESPGTFESPRLDLFAQFSRRHLQRGDAGRGHWRVHLLAPLSASFAPIATRRARPTARGHWQPVSSESTQTVRRSGRIEQLRKILSRLPGHDVTIRDSIKHD